MSILRMRIIVLIDQLKKVTAVAEALNIKQPSVSFHMKKLEEEWEAKLFEWKTGKVVLTEAGRLLLYYARQIVASSDEAGRRMRELTRNDRHRLVIGCSGPISSALLSGKLLAYSAGGHGLGKDWSVTVTTGDMEALMDKLVAGELDLLLYGAAGTTDKGEGWSQTAESALLRKNPLVKSEELVRSPLMLAVAPHHPLLGVQPLHAADVLHYPFIALGDISVEAACMEWEAAQQLELRPTLKLDQASLVLQATADGLGVSIVPELMARLHPALTCLSLPGTAPMWSLHALRLVAHWNPPLVRRALDVLAWT